MPLRITAKPLKGFFSRGFDCRLQILSKPKINGLHHLNMFAVSIVIGAIGSIVTNVAAFEVDSRPPAKTETTVHSRSEHDLQAPTAVDGVDTRQSTDVAGQKLFIDYCASCHGDNGTGLPDLGYNLTDSVFIRSQTDADLKEFLMMGRQPGSPDSKMDLLMPAFDYLTDDELARAVSHLRRLNGD